MADKTLHLPDGEWVMKITVSVTIERVDEPSVPGPSPGPGPTPPPELGSDKLEVAEDGDLKVGTNCKLKVE